MKKSGASQGQSASELSSKRIVELGDWRGDTLSRMRKPTFPTGASLKDPPRLFNSSLDGNARRAIDIHEGEEAMRSPSTVLASRNLRRKRSPKTKWTMPDAVDLPAPGVVLVEPAPRLARRQRRYFGIGGSPVKDRVSSVRHGGDGAGVRARHLRVPVGKYAARVILPHPRMQRPELKSVVLLECPTEQDRWRGAAAACGVRNDVLHSHQSHLAVALGFVEQQLRRLDARGGIDEGNVPVVESHPAFRTFHARRDLRRPPGRRRLGEVVERRRHLAQRGEILVHRGGLRRACESLRLELGGDFGRGACLLAAAAPPTQ